MTGLLRFLLHYKPGAAFFILGGLLLAASMAVVTQYGMKGRVDVAAMIDRDADLKPFWQRNPRLQYLDSFPRTSFLIVKDTQTGLPAMLDTGVVSNAEARPTACSAEGGLKSALLPADAGQLVCFQLVKPDTGAGDSFIGAVSFQSKGKDAQVAQFYRDLFLSRLNRVNTLVDDSRGVVLEAEDAHGNTLARVSTRSSFGTVNTFFAWTRDLDPPQN